MISIIEAIEDANLFRPLFNDLSSWTAWQVFLKALFGLSMSKSDLAVFRQCTGRETASGRPFREAWVVAGRRGGKSFIAALVGVYLASFRDYRPHLAPGERAHILVVAADRQQAQVVFRYVKGFLAVNPMLARMVEAERVDSVDLTNRVTLSVATCSFRGIRGYTLAAAICDETAFWRDENSSNPAEEVIRAVRPALATIPGSLLLCISSPYARSGPLWEVYQKHYARQDSDILVWQASTRVMNPTIAQNLIDRDLADDPEAAKSEWGAEFRSDLETFIPWEALETVVVPGRHELPPKEGVTYTAFVDPSGGRGDAAALALAHVEGDRVILDLARRWAAPHNPQAVIQEMAEVVKAYGVRRVTGDRYAGEWPRQEFQRHNVWYDPAAKDKSWIYLDFLPLVMSGRCELLDLKQLISELRDLVRRPRSGGRDLVDHPPRGSDDLANAVAGTCTIAGAEMLRFRGRVRWIGGDSPWQQVGSLADLF